MPHPQILAFGYHFFLGENKCWGVGVCGGGGGGGGEARYQAMQTQSRLLADGPEMESIVIIVITA